MRSEACQVLVIGDPEECTEIATAIPRSLSKLRLGGEDVVLEIQTEELVLHRSWEVDFGQGRWDLCVFFLSSRDAHLFIGNNKLLQDRTRGIMFITEDQRRLPGNWSLRHHRDLLYSRPFTDNMLSARLEQVLFRLYQREVADITDQEILRFTRHLLDEDTPGSVLDPVPLAASPRGFGYPTVSTYFGMNVDDGAVLEHMATLGLLAKRLANRVRHCPACDAWQLNYRQHCPRCASMDFLQETIIHHFSCGHMGPLKEFYRQGDLVCTKCHKRLKQIGVDYEKPATNHRCQDCAHLFADPDVAAECVHCGTVSAPASTRERTVFAYKLQPFAQQAVSSDSVQAVDLSSLLGASSTGLASRQLFIYELNRDIQRYKRYRTPCSIVLVRVNNLDELQEQLEGEFNDYVQMLFAAVGSSLRSLDITCIWDHNLLAVLLPGTPVDGAWVVARRMEEQAQHIDLPFQVSGPRISTSAEAVRDETTSHQDLIDNALRIHDDINAIAERDFMPE
ncbi:MAG: diguanylate cyclase domain-containing protein [Planctomycetota bacterium]